MKRNGFSDYIFLCLLSIMNYLLFDFCKSFFTVKIVSLERIEISIRSKMAFQEQILFYPRIIDFFNLKFSKIV